MHGNETTTWQESDLKSPRRNRFFHGKLMDAYHFELETNYLNAKRWLINRLLIGTGAVCGLDVCPGKNPNEIVITPGVAIDGVGREIIVPCEITLPLPLPPKVITASTGGPYEPPPPAVAGTRRTGSTYGGDDDDEEEEEEENEDTGWVTVFLCYHECMEDPTPVLAGDCNGSQPCTPGTIREGFKFEFRGGKLPPIEFDCHIEDVLGPRKIHYDTMVTWFAEGCAELPDDPCIPLANIHIDSQGSCDADDIDINIRPIIFTNPLLFEMFLDLIRGQRLTSSGPRPRTPTSHTR